MYVPSSSTIITVVYPLLLATKTSVGRDRGFTVTLKFSLLSTILSSIMDIFKVTSVSPALNVTLYGSET